jgi:hypothetical protein
MYLCKKKLKHKIDLKMKKIGLLLIGLTIAIFANGQTLKIQGGTSISKLEWEAFNNTFFDQTLIGYSIFAGIDYFDKKYFNFSSNIGMVRRGGKDEIQFFDEHALPIGYKTEKATLDYLSINTTFDVKYRIKKSVTPFISFGPRCDILYG